MSERTSFALFDAAALTTEERQALRAVPDAVWAYDNQSDDQAAGMGPVWVPLDAHADALVNHLWADEARAWAASRGESEGDYQQLSHHLRGLRYVHTHDGQRYFFRFADTRCLTAMAGALEADRKEHLTGPITHWQYMGRNGLPAALQASARHAIQPGLRRLRADELGALLDATWPDQLLASAEDEAPSAVAAIPMAQRHAWACQLCGLLRAHRVEAYPVQLEAMLCVLRTGGAAVEDPAFVSVLQQAQQQGAPELLAAFSAPAREAGR